MKTNCGKGYFYAMGQRDGWLHSQVSESYRAIVKSRRRQWQEWASEAYYRGYWGLEA